MEKIKEKCELILDHNPVDAINDIMDETFGKKKHDLVSKQDLKSTILKNLPEEKKEEFDGNTEAYLTKINQEIGFNQCLRDVISLIKNI